MLFAWYSADVDKTNVVLQETNLMWPISVTDCKESCEVVLSASKTEETFSYSKCIANVNESNCSQDDLTESQKMGWCIDIHEAGNISANSAKKYEHWDVWIVREKRGPTRNKPSWTPQHQQSMCALFIRATWAKVVTEATMLNPLD